VEDKITSVKSNIGTTINVSPAGARGFEGGGEALTTEQMNSVSKLANVSSVTQTLSDRLTTENTSLVSSIEAGSLGNRAQGNSGIGFQAPPSGMIPQMNAERSSSDSTTQITRTFTPPVTITGTNDTATASVYGGDSVNFTSGKALDASKDENNAVLGKAIAQKNSLSVGSTFTAYGETITVVGIYDTGSAFANNGVIVSLSTLQRLSAQPGSVTSATVTVNSIDSVQGATTSIKSALGDKADIVSDQETAKTAVQPLESVKTVSTYSVIGAIGAGAVIILLTMMMIVRERRREIGVMKAIGSTNAKTMLQFISEAVTLTLLGLVVGLALSVVASQPITKVLVNNSTSSAADSVQQRGPAGGMRLMGGANSPLRGVQDVQASVGTSVLAYGVGAAFLIAVLGSALPAYLISKVRPAEVMRAD
jgi:putative ABC transport system permease protein